MLPSNTRASHPPPDGLVPGQDDRSDSSSDSESESSRPVSPVQDTAAPEQPELLSLLPLPEASVVQRITPTVDHIRSTRRTHQGLLVIGSLQYRKLPSPTA